MAGIRPYNFIPGPETPTLPSTSTPTASDDLVPLGFGDLRYGGMSINIQGSLGSPINITAAGGITPTVGARIQLMFVQGSGGVVDITANPQIVAGTIIGQVLWLYGCSNTNTLQVDDGTGVGSNGSIILGLDWMAGYMWNGSYWNLISLSERT